VLGDTDARDEGKLGCRYRFQAVGSLLGFNETHLAPTHPGEHLKAELKAWDMSAAELARKLSVATNRITHILNGRRGITGDTALRLSHFFGTSSEFWLNLQNLDDLRLAQQKAGKAIDRLPTLKKNSRIAWAAFDGTVHLLVDEGTLPKRDIVRTERSGD
jgi:addiction module HigA family antidote